MKQTLSILALLTFVYIQTFNSMVWMNYEINKSQIIEKFCVNKEKPEMHCEGTCHMKKMMLSKDKEKETEALVFLPEINLFLDWVEVRLEKEIIVNELEEFYQDNYHYRFSNDWQIPPKV